MSTKIKNIDKYIRNIRNTITMAELNYGIWWIYVSKQTRPIFHDTMKMYSSFFKTSIHAHFVAMIIALYRLYETRRDTISFYKLLKELSRENPLSESAAKRVNKLMQQSKPIWIKVGIIRSEVIAHLNDARSIEESFKRADIKYDQVKELIEFSKTTFNVITQDYDRSTYLFNTSAEFDTIALLRDLQLSAALLEKLEKAEKNY